MHLTLSVVYYLTGYWNPLQIPQSPSCGDLFKMILAGTLNLKTYAIFLIDKRIHNRTLQPAIFFIETASLQDCHEVIYKEIKQHELQT